MALSMCWSYLFLLSKGPSKIQVLYAAHCSTCKTCFISEHLLKQTTTKLMTSINIQLEVLNPTEIENPLMHLFQMQSLTLS
jgi:hypothetical protein